MISDLTSGSARPLASRYDEGCAAAFTLGVVGDRWALLVVRELLLSSKRFQQIRAGLPGITASVLTRRLQDLVDAGLVHHDTRLGVYSLTQDGRDLRPVLHELGRWGAGRPGHDPRKFLSPTACMLSMPVMVNHAAARELHRRRRGARWGFDLGQERFTVTIDADGVPRPVAADTGGAAESLGEATFVGPANVVAGSLYAPLPLEHWVGSGQLRIEGDRAAAEAFAAVFAKLPPPS